MVLPAQEWEKGRKVVKDGDRTVSGGRDMHYGKYMQHIFDQTFKQIVETLLYYIQVL